jgi:hypothetical protein
MEKYGIETIKKAVEAGVIVLNTAGKVYEDERVDLSDLVFVPELIAPITTMITLDYAIISAEFSDLSKDEMNELVLYFNEKFDIPQENIEAWIEATLNSVMKIIDAIMSAVKVQAEFFKR